MAPRIGTEELYTTQIGELWGVLTRTLSRLDELAADPDRLDDGAVPHVLRRLQYALHTAGERVVGLAPDAGAEAAHTELWSALASARDMTARVAEALEQDRREVVDLLVYEWRGALFRVRLARLRLAAAPPAPVLPEDDVRRQIRPQIAALMLVVCGACTFALGATMGHWPIWAAGMLAVCGSTLVYRP